MRLPINLGLKVYLLLFAIFAITTLVSLCSPEGDTFIYYNIILRLNPLGFLWYALAIFDAIITCMVIAPLSEKAYSRTSHWIIFYRWLLILRIPAFCLGHNYDFLMLRAAFHDTPARGYITLGVWLLFLYPSFREHYKLVFHSK